jgi:hypothetical protein
VVVLHKDIPNAENRKIRRSLSNNKKTTVVAKAARRDEHRPRHSKTCGGEMARAAGLTGGRHRAVFLRKH